MLAGHFTKIITQEISLFHSSARLIADHLNGFASQIGRAFLSAGGVTISELSHSEKRAASSSFGPTDQPRFAQLWSALISESLTSRMCSDWFSLSSLRAVVRIRPARKHTQRLSLPTTIHYTATADSFAAATHYNLIKRLLSSNTTPVTGLLCAASCRWHRAFLVALLVVPILPSLADGIGKRDPRQLVLKRESFSIAAINQTVSRLEVWTRSWFCHRNTRHRHESYQCYVYSLHFIDVILFIIGRCIK